MSKPFCIITLVLFGFLENLQAKQIHLKDTLLINRNQYDSMIDYFNKVSNFNKLNIKQCLSIIRIMNTGAYCGTNHQDSERYVHFFEKVEQNKSIIFSKINMERLGWGYYSKKYDIYWGGRRRNSDKCYKVIDCK